LALKTAAGVNPHKPKQHCADHREFGRQEHARFMHGLGEELRLPEEEGGCAEEQRHAEPPQMACDPVCAGNAVP
jgi:hypothetical protein